MAINYKNILKGLGLVPNSTSLSTTLGDVEVTTNNKLNFHNGTSNSPVVTEFHPAYLQNKDISAATTRIVDETDTTKAVSFLVTPSTSGVETILRLQSTSQHTISFPDATTTLVGTDVTQTLTNKTLDGTNNTFTNIPSSALPTNLVTTTGTQTVTNKTLTAPVLTSPTADTITGIAGASLVVQPASGQNLSLGSNGSGLISLDNITVKTDTISTSTGPLKIGAFSGSNVLVNASGANIQLQRSGVTVATFDATGVTLNTAKALVLSNNLQTVSLIANPAASATYTITVPAAAPVANTALSFDGTNYVWSSAGGWTMSSSLALTAGGTVSVSATAGQQAVEVQGSTAPVTLSSTPFGGTTPSNGIVIRLIGRSNTNTVSVINNDGAKGCYLNGNATLGLGDVIELQYLTSIDRYVETFRNF